MVCCAGRSGDRHAVVAVLDEMALPHPVDLDGRKGLTAPLHQSQVHPAGAQPVGRGPEPAIEIPARIKRADDRVQPYRLQAQTALAAPAERADDLFQGQQLAAVRLAAQPVLQAARDLAPPGPEEVVLRVSLGEPGVSEHRCVLAGLR